MVSCVRYGRTLTSADADLRCDDDDEMCRRTTHITPNSSCAWCIGRIQSKKTACAHYAARACAFAGAGPSTYLSRFVVVGVSHFALLYVVPYHTHMHAIFPLLHINRTSYARARVHYTTPDKPDYSSHTHKKDRYGASMCSLCFVQHFLCVCLVCKLVA